MLSETKVRILFPVLLYLGFCASMFLVLFWFGNEASRGDVWSIAVLIAAVGAYSYVVVSTNDPQAAHMHPRGTEANSTESAKEASLASMRGSFRKMARREGFASEARDV